VIEKKIFFNGLNELRAFAALAVIWHHIELFKSGDHIGSLFGSGYFSYFISNIGENGVHLFFVLSGFLITFLLLKEKEKHSTVLFKKFYLRRIFRIWPLYYLIVIIGFILIPFLAHTFDIFERVPFYYELISNPKNYSLNSALLYLLFLPNLAKLYFRVPGCSQAWSVGVEEQFYILWPLLIYVFARKKIVWVFVLLLLIFIFSHVFIQPDSFHLLPKNSSFTVMLTPRIYLILKILPIEYMTIGAVGGYLYAYHKDKVNDFSKSKYTYFLILGLIFVLLFFLITSKYFQNIILSFLFLSLILITVDDDNSVVFRNKLMSYLGTISYGIYMYHPFVMFLVFPFVNTYLKDNIIGYNVFVYGLVVGLTLIISHLSYKFIELRFIKYKDKKYKSL
jgi:peptidoglycan/LPS O-acetylase OafA/YrhL